MTATPATEEKMLARKNGGVAEVIFNNPARHNAMSFEMWQGMAEVLNAYAVDPEVRVVILKGAGEKAFVAGADISQFKERRTGPEAVAEYNAMADSANKALVNCPKPTIAMVRGYCILCGRPLNLMDLRKFPGYDEP